MGDQPTGERQARNAQASKVMGLKSDQGSKIIWPVSPPCQERFPRARKIWKMAKLLFLISLLTFVRVLGAVKDQNKHKDGRKNEVGLDPGVITLIYCFTSVAQLVGPRLPGFNWCDFLKTKSNLHFWFHCSWKWVIFARWSTASVGFACARRTPTLHDLVWSSHVNSHHGLIGHCI